MVVQVKLDDGAFMEVRIKDGLLDEIFYQGSVEKMTLSRNKDCEHMKMWLNDILKENVYQFKKILYNIKEDQEFFAYGKCLLEAAKERKMKALMAYRKEFERRIEQMEEGVKRYVLE